MTSAQPLRGVSVVILKPCWGTTTQTKDFAVRDLTGSGTVGGCWNILMHTWACGLIENLMRNGYIIMKSVVTRLIKRVTVIH